MKKRLKKLNVKVQIAAIVVGLIIVGVLGYVVVVAPQQAHAAKLRKEVAAQQLAIYKRQAELRIAQSPPTIETADLFKLARAMPDREDMPGIILTLSEVARAAGIRFDLIEPGSGAPAPTGSYTVDRIHLVFSGDFYGLSDFLYRIRSLVTVRGGQLQAAGRLFNVDTVTFNAGGNTFPQISADLYLDAYVYAPAPPPATGPTTQSPTAPGTTTTTTTTTTDSSLPTSASATGATH